MANINDEKIKNQTIQIFNIAEKPIMEYIASFLDESPDVIFNDKVPDISDPLILLPIEDYKKNIYLKFTLEIMTKKQSTANKTRAKNIDDIINHKNVKEAIGFLLYCIKAVLPSIVASCMIVNKPMVNTSLILNETTWTFDPVFNHDLTIKKTFLEESLSKLTYMKQERNEPLPPEMKPKIEKEYRNVATELAKVTSELTLDITEEEKKINKSYNDRPVLAIVCEEITKSQLPKSKYENKPQLPFLSNKAYEDHD